MIALDKERWLFYEGQARYGHALWPSPFVSVATVLRAERDVYDIPDNLDLGYAELVFREDAFDPVTRIRRGRFYQRQEGMQPQEWRVQKHPAVDEDTGRRDPEGYFVKSLFGFQVWRASMHLRGTRPEVVLAVGTKDAMTLWRVIGIERISTGEDLVTLKARSNLGVLPEIKEDALPPSSRARIRECLDKMMETVYRAGPESVVDRCRDAATAILGTWLEQEYPGALKKDLGDLAKMVGGSGEKAILENAAKILARLHARAKPNVQEKYSSRPLAETDAQLAVECVTVILREVDWVMG